MTDNAQPEVQNSTPATDGSPPPVTEIKIPEDEHPALREAFDKLNALMAQHSDLRVRFLQEEQRIISQRQGLIQERDALLRVITRKLSVPNGWALEVDTFTFRPQNGIPNQG